MNDPNHFKNTGYDRKQPFNPQKPWGQSVERPPATGAMPFGKHKGMPITSLPFEYVIWLKKNVDLHGQLLADVDSTLAYWKRLLASVESPKSALVQVEAVYEAL